MSARVAKLAAAAFAAGVALAVLPLSLRRPAPPPPAPVAITHGPVVIPSLSAGLVRWSTSERAPTAIWLWEHGQDPRSGRAVAGEGPATAHALPVRGLRPRAAYRFRLALGGGRWTSGAHELNLRDVEPRVEVRFDAPDLLRVYLDEPDELTPGVALVPPGGRCAFRWSERRGPGAIELLARIPDPGQKYLLHVVHRELDDPDVCPRTPHPLEVAGLRRFAGWLAVAMDGAPSGFATLAAAAIDAARREYPERFGARPSHEQRARLAVAARTRVLHAMERVARDGLRQQGLDPQLISSALPLLAAGRAPGDRRLAVAAALRLAVFDSAADAATGRPLYGFARAAGLRAVESAPSASAYRPVLALPNRAVRGLRTFPAIPVFSRALDAEAGLWSEVDAWMEAARELTGGSLEPASKSRGPWHALGELPRALAPAAGLRVHARIAALEPPSALTLKIGWLEVPLRVAAADFRGFLAPPGPARPPLEQLSARCAVAIPPGVLRPDDRALAIAFDTVPDRAGAGEPARAVWLTDLAIEPLAALPSAPEQEDTWRPSAQPSPSPPSSSPATSPPGAAR